MAFVDEGILSICLLHFYQHTKRRGRLRNHPSVRDETMATQNF